MDFKPTTSVITECNEQVLDGWMDGFVLKTYHNMKSPMLAWFMLIQGFSMLTRLFLRSYSCNANIVNLFFAIGKFTQKSFCLFSHDSKNTKKSLYQRYNDFLKVLRASWKPLSTGDRGRTDTPSTGTGFWVQRVCQFRHAGKLIY